MNNLVFKNESSHKFKFLTEFKNILDEAIKEFNLDKFIEVDLLFVVAPKMKKLNKLYRNKNYVTDVLSFPFESNLEFSFLDTIPLGQIIISPWKIKKQAKNLNHSIKREFCYIFTHGIAHLLGYDHQTEEEAKIMNEHVENIMRKMNITRSK